ncbi:MAG: hypothetical protein KIT68_02955 [Phycisphaeraceae bacterium]|nr:hypothetical protein [Phycisphaeraceae bacterium]
MRAERLGAPPRLRIEPAGEVEPEWTGAAQVAWEAMCGANARLHDGPILSVRWFEPASGRGACVPERYRRLAVQAHPAVGDLGVRLLGVKGLIEGRDGGGALRVLLARRSAQTLMYPGQWEIAPGGGVPVPRAGVSEVGAEHLGAALSAEASEELHVEIGAGGPDWCAVVYDERARSVDLIGRESWPGGVVTDRAGVCRVGGGWEYVDAWWATPEEAMRFGAQRPETVSAPTLAVLALMYGRE